MKTATGMSERFDFDAARRRLLEGEGDSLLEARVREIFAERARLLAQPTRVADGQVERSHLCFTAGAVRFAVALTSIRAVFVPAHVTPIPGAPVHLAEVVHVDGRIVSLVDLVVLLGLAAGAGQTARRPIVLLESQGRLLGCQADRLAGLSPVETSRLAPAVHARGSEFVLGIADDMTLVLDAPLLIESLRAPGGKPRALTRGEP
jgi:chemotaxis signal transduction protein